MAEFSILVVDDDPDYLRGVIRQLKKVFDTMEIFGAGDGQEALTLMADKEIGVLLSDLRMPCMSGHDLLEKALKKNPELCAVMVTGYATVEAAVQALKAGAWDFITKPVEKQTLIHTVEKAVQHYGLARENRRLAALVASMTTDKDCQWQSPVMKHLHERLVAVAATDYTVLITGESGAGKEFVARELHRLSTRKNNACHTLNCPAIPDSLLESELFGHVKGAFTGAERNRDGFFLAADKGTLILDEIGDISLSTQAKLLKFLQDKEVKPVGSSMSKVTDVRILALTNQNLEQEIKEGRFRQDLYYRLNVLSVTVPPLRERADDIPLLVRIFLDRTCREMQLKPMEILPVAMAYLARQPWPGNVRELLNYVRRLAVFSSGRTIDQALIRLVDGESTDFLTTKEPEESDRVGYKAAKQDAMDLFSRDYLGRMFTQTQGNISETSRLSGLERASIQKIVKRLGMDMDAFRRGEKTLK